ncbi:MAG: hypothetical protein HYZ42_08170 [Bacteroidetes bacterium]|nr:hypothetical protein [Bacteroidota bacterium]
MVEKSTTELDVLIKDFGNRLINIEENNLDIPSDFQTNLFENQTEDEKLNH